MELLGNMFTHYQYSTTDILINNSVISTSISSNRSKFNVEIENSNSHVNLPENSPFPNWKSARRFAGPLPFTFTYEKVNESVLIIEGVRQNWDPQAINVTTYSFDFLDKLKLRSLVLANAFEITNIPSLKRKIGKIK